MKQLTEAAQAAKQIKAELKKEFPSIKFSVKSSNFSMGNSVNIGWTNGPTDKKVCAITDKYQYGHFDGMTDTYENTNNRTDIPQAKYVMAQRTITEDIRKMAFNFLKEYFSHYENDYEVERDVHRFLYNMDLSGEITGFKSVKSSGTIEDLFDPIKNDPEPETKEIKINGSFEIVDYSEKAIAIFGDTKPIKDALKAIGGKFNFRLTHNGDKKPGWIFSKTKREELNNLLSTGSNF
jgi:hypothetical protein